ncbi:MAG TPA: Sua5/YciO/YrdC/YwlC family protein [Woeseiaceae bacterium]|nr:Sua5/YciO/YrdC/YwlC family protein [Woeseiaceae bacterium]
MVLSIPVLKAARILKRGGVVAYPTEGVFGLGCLAGAEDAAKRILAIKKRDPSMGLILIAADPLQLEPYAALPKGAARLRSSADHPVTWVLPARSSTPAWIRGKHAGVAVRLTTHPVAAALCDAAGSALVSTSANIAGQAPARNAFILRRTFGPLVDYIVPGELGPARGPSEIRDFASGKILRPAQ